MHLFTYICSCKTKLLYICPLLVGCSKAGVNVAVGKPARQSSTYDRLGGVPGETGPRRAYLAVDGQPSSGPCTTLDQSDGLYSHTNVTANSWWTVDLQQRCYIYEISVCNRGGHWSKLSATSPCFKSSESQIEYMNVNATLNSMCMYIGNLNRIRRLLMTFLISEF